MPRIISLWNDIGVTTETVSLEEPAESTGRHDKYLLCLFFPVHLSFKVLSLTGRYFTNSMEQSSS